MLSRLPHPPARRPVLRRGYVLVLLGLWSGGMGCGITKYGSRNLVEPPINTRDKAAECIRDQRLAEAAWAEVQSAQPDQVYSVHYVGGFKDGYVDYLYYGGTGAPPVMPPWCYRQAAYETPEGQQAVNDWFAGFHHGVIVAQASGYRASVIVPLALRAAPSPSSGDPRGTGPAPEAPETVPMLPPPRLVPPVPEGAEASSR